MNYQTLIAQRELFPVEEYTEARHPAVYSDALIDLLNGVLPVDGVILDVFGGTGRLKEIRPDAICMDIEHEWAMLSGLQADALALPFANNSVDTICTSPTYGNRMADSYVSNDMTKRSYTNWLRRELSANNSGGMQWGEEYRNFHIRAWREAHRVLKGLLFLNIKDHIRNRNVVRVTDWHISTIIEIGFDIVDKHFVETPSYRKGENGTDRIGGEWVIKFVKALEEA